MIRDKEQYLANKKIQDECKHMLWRIVPGCKFPLKLECDKCKFRKVMVREDY